jgi:hypothetical protein
MRARLEDRNKAIELRKCGMSYKQIQAVVPVSKGLLSGWFENLQLTHEEESNLKLKIKERIDRGRIGSLISNRSRRIERERIVIKEAEVVFKKYKADPVFLMGVVLYWAEGAKKSDHFQFINSDPDMVVMMNKWIIKFLKVPKDSIRPRLFIHKVPGYEGAEEFWAKSLGIDLDLFQKTIYKPTKHKVKKNPFYQGCLRLDIFGIRYLRLMNAWQKLLIQYYDGAFK